MAEPPGKSTDQRGWGARGRMKDASSTDIVVHAGTALSSFYQCGDLYAMDPITLEQLGPVDWGGRFPAEGVSAHTNVDERSGELLFFNCSTAEPYMNYGVVGPDGDLVHYTPSTARRSNCPVPGCPTTWRSPTATSGATGCWPEVLMRSATRVQRAVESEQHESFGVVVSGAIPDGTVTPNRHAGRYGERR